MAGKKQFGYVTGTFLNRKIYVLNSSKKHTILIFRKLGKKITVYLIPKTKGLVGSILWGLLYGVGSLKAMGISDPKFDNTPEFIFAEIIKANIKLLIACVYRRPFALSAYSLFETLSTSALAPSWYRRF